MSIFSNRLKYVRGEIYNSTADDFQYPELQYPNVAERQNVGIAFSGGGTRSASATLGQLRGLHELELLDQVRYISAVSGGSWACIPFTYLPESWMDKTFLGTQIPPEMINAEYLLKTDRNSYAHAVANSIILDDIIEQAALLAGDETFSRAAGEIFLTPFNINSLSQFFSFDESAVNGILTRNDNMRATDFQLVRPGRPFLIVGGIFIREQNDYPHDRLPFEMTPLYVGINQLYEKAGSNRRPIGGGYVEPFAFDSDETDRFSSGHPVKVRLGPSRHRFTLSDMMGVAGAAPAEVLAQLGIDFVGFPEFKYWPPVSPKTRAKEYNFGDGGILENLGVMPLLRRKVKKIILFVNTQHPLAHKSINESIPPLFGQTPDFMVNHVFPGQQYRDLFGELLAKKASGKTVMHQDQYTVLSNPFHGIEGGWEVEVLWIYNERVTEWEEQLTADIQPLIGSGSLGNFPHYRTFFQNPPKLIDLSAKQVTMLAHLSCWNVLENQDTFSEMLTSN